MCFRMYIVCVVGAWYVVWVCGMCGVGGMGMVGVVHVRELCVRVHVCVLACTVCRM